MHLLQNVKILRKLSERQIEFLMETHERQLLRQPPCTLHSSKVASGLILQGLVEVRAYNKQNRRLIGVYITQAGIEVLEAL